MANATDDFNQKYLEQNSVEFDQTGNTNTAGPKQDYESAKDVSEKKISKIDAVGDSPDDKANEKNESPKVDSGTNSDSKSAGFETQTRRKSVHESIAGGIYDNVR